METFGAGNSWVGGADFRTGLNAGLRAGAYGAAGGAIIGGTIAGIRAVGHGETFWTGKENFSKMGGDPNFTDGGDGHKPELHKVEESAVSKARKNGVYDHGEKGINRKSGSRFDLYRDGDGNVYKTLKGNPKGGEIELVPEVKWKNGVLIRNSLFPVTTPRATIFDIPVGNFDLLQLIFDMSKPNQTIPVPQG